MDVITPAYDRGVRFGYQKGEMERIALATANSNLRSDLLSAQQELVRLHRLINEIDAVVDPENSPSYSADGPSWKTSTITSVRKIIEGL